MSAIAPCLLATAGWREMVLSPELPPGTCATPYTIPTLRDLNTTNICSGLQTIAISRHRRLVHLPTLSAGVIPYSKALQSEMLKRFGIQKNTDSSKKGTNHDVEVDGFVILGGSSNRESGIGLEPDMTLPFLGLTSGEWGTPMELPGETASERQMLQSPMPIEEVTSSCCQSTEEQDIQQMMGETTVQTDKTWTAQQMKQTKESFPVTTELLSDVPFTLAPHILALQANFLDLPATLHLPKNMNENVANVWYDFTLENSVLSGSLE
ncbi:UBAP1-MVB12-associated (UMA)-domain containing protein 1 isoform X2 [Scyliorhinus torazame]|uniref:UBAP1-MVB12-associated (UMA)-domain containing protein 1 isoform X2 n=1 Tax=Scyliorhinus torazame TaxID=75743 RepID=UPI003B5B2A35